MGYTVGQMAQLLGVAPSTLRYYDKEGLLPFVERTPGGSRMFQERDYEVLRTIECLKQTGMRLRDIRRYLQLVQQGDGTIGARLTLIRDQRRKVEEQLQKLQETLELLEFKCWYYETALESGTEQSRQDIEEEEIPARYQIVYHRLRKIPSGDPAPMEHEGGIVQG